MTCALLLAFIEWSATRILEKDQGLSQLRERPFCFAVLNVMGHYRPSEADDFSNRNITTFLPSFFASYTTPTKPPPAATTG
jgi:hypothetical protein